MSSMIIEGQCKTCRSWNGRCHHPKLSPNNIPLPPDGATVDSDEFGGQDYGGILTGPEFGCIHYTKKEGVESE